MALISGTRIADRFEITGPLGAGSMGEVYQAHDRKLHRDVAVKLLSHALAASEEHLLRFEREARAASSLNHPNICTIYDVGQAAEAGGRPYLVMELLKGQTLFELLASGPLPVTSVVGLGVQIADALDAAHAAAIVHRDIKPANIFVTTRGDAKLLDFGLAAIAEAPDQSLGGRSPEAAALTNPGAAVGTALYMSPEQAMGDPLDARSDLFSFGLVLYEMLTGQRAFDGRSTTAIVDAILHAEPVGLGPQDTSNIPRDLRRLISRMLSKDKAQRPASAAEVASFLNAVNSGSIAGREFAAAYTESSAGSRGLTVGSNVFRKTPGHTPAAASSGLSRAFDGRDFRGVSTIAIALLLVVVAAYWGVNRNRSAVAPIPSREPLLLADFANTTGEAVFDGALKDALEIQLQQSPYMNVVSASQVRSTLLMMQRPADERLTAAVAHDLCQRMGIKAILLGSIAPLGVAYVIGLEAQSCPTGEIIAREQVQAPSKTDVLASVGAAAARLRETLGESIGSIQRFNVPIQNATTASLEALKAYSLGVQTRTTTGDVQAIPFFERALELDPNFAVASARLASIYTNLRDVAQARKYMERAFTRSDSLSEPERLFIKSNHDYIVTGKLGEVVGTYRLWINTYPHDWIPHNNLSSTYERLGQLDAALQEAREAVRLAPTSVVGYQQLARTLLALDRIDECKAVLQDAARRGLDSSYMRAHLFDLAFLDGDAGGMEEQLRASAARADSYLVLTEAARAALASGQVETSRTLYAQAIAAARTARINDVAGSLFAEQAVADALQNDSDRAHQQLDAALRISSGSDTTWTSALAAAFSGRAALAAQLAERYRQSAPPAADVTQALAPVLAAAIALANNDGRRALDVLAGGSPYERTVGPWLPYLRGLAHASLKDHAAAASQFRRIIASRGNKPTHFLHTLARLQLARTLRAQGKSAEARQAYADFSDRLRNGDPRHRLIISANREAAALPVEHP